MDAENLKQQVSQLINIGIGLTSTRSLDDLLSQIVSDARDFTHSDAGSLYLVEKGSLRFVVAQNNTLEQRSSGDSPQSEFTDQLIPISNKSMAGYVANTGEILNIEDAYEISSERTYSFNKEFDQLNDYRSKSMLLVPMKTREGEIIGVLQLINAMDSEGEAIAFKQSYEDFVTALASQAAVAVRNVQLTEKLKEAYFQVIVALSAAAEYKDKDTALHLERMSQYSALIAKGLNLPEEEQEMVRYASPMHDVGKIGISDAILLKPGPLTPEERLQMENHTLYGGDIIARSNTASDKLLREAEIIALTHHEKWNGTGYPEGLAEESIPILGRIVALADVFDALTSRRCYKPAFPFEKVLGMIDEGRETHFDPACVDAFFADIEQVKVIYEALGEGDQSEP